MSWAADGRMEMDCILFFQVYRFYLEKLAKTQIRVYFLYKISLDIFLLVLYKHFAIKVLSINLRQFLPPNLKIIVT